MSVSDARISDTVPSMSRVSAVFAEVERYLAGTETTADFTPDMER